MNDVTEIETTGLVPVKSQVIASNALLDPAYFQQVESFAGIMAHSSLIPDALRYDGTGNNKKLKPFDEVKANCFLVANQAFKWGMEPFGVAQACSIVHGRLMFEGKLVAAVLRANLGVRLHYEFGKWDNKKAETDLTQTGEGDNLGVRVYEVNGINADGDLVFGKRYIDGHVGGWKTTGDNSAWGRPANHRDMLSYRGARQWARRFEPAIMIGVVTDDEADFFDSLKDITPPAQATAADVMEKLKSKGETGAGGFDSSRVQQQTASKTSEGGTSSSKPSEQEGDGAGNASTSSSTSQASEQQTDLLGDAGDKTSKQDGEQTSSQGSPSTSFTEADEASEKKQETKPADSAKKTIAYNAKWLADVATMLWCATNFQGDPKILKAQRKAAAASYPTEDIEQKYKDKAASVFDRCMDVVSGSLEPQDAIEIISGLSGVEVEALAAAHKKARG